MFDLPDLLYQFDSEYIRSAAARFDVLGLGSIEVTAVITGAFLLRGRNWARWAAIAWIAIHVVVSALNGFSQFAVHCLICAGIVYLLSRRDAAEYFAAG